MLPIIIGGIVAVGTIAAGIYASLANDTNNAREEYNNAKKEYFSSISQLKKEVKEAKAEALHSYNPFEILHPLYVASIKSADKAYKAKSDIKYVISSTYNRIDELKSKMSELYNKTKTQIRYDEKQKIFDELSELKKLKVLMYNDVENSKQDYKDFMDKLLSFNHETHSLKIYIRDNCGHGGRVWYERKQKNV